MVSHMRKHVVSEPHVRHCCDTEHEVREERECDGWRPDSIIGRQEKEQGNSLASWLIGKAGAIRQAVVLTALRFVMS